ncbi:SDR family oxidoreductase [Polymorphospora sp. NPDC051019]|uniref:SDR family oxidoreductase n=1 Tax=Polymorphospora sp. NPDC051019 TaxID=3155725 RepID=UPI0034440D00
MRIAVAGGTGAVGRHVVDVLRERGHEAVVLARSTGVDLVAGTGLAATLGGVRAVVDVTSVSTRSAEVAERFFRAVTTNLLTAGVRHLLVLSIVGIDRAPFGYYAGKVAQERLVANGGQPWTILRATQFHEFATQIYRQLRFGPLTLIPTMRSQPVAAREVAQRLVDLAEGEPVGRATDLGGPREEMMADLVRAYARSVGARGPVIQFPLPGAFGRAMRDGALVAGPAAEHGTQTFAEWLARRPAP